MRSLRILHAVRSDSFAGVEQFVRRLALAQRASGHEVSVIGGAPVQLADELRAAGVGYQPGVRTVEVTRRVRRLAGQVDVVNTHMTAADGAAAIGLLGVRDRPALVSTRHFAQHRGSHWPAFVYRAIEARIDAEISVSRTVAAAIGRPSAVVYPGIESRTGAIAARSRVVLAAQRLQPEKRTDVAVRAFAASGLADEGWLLQIAGDGAERSALEDVAARLGMAGSVRFLGFRRDIPELMARAALLIAPCPREHLGLTILEAMDAGLPVVAADAAGHRELLEGVDPRARFPADDMDAAASALRLFAHDQGAREALAEQQRQRQRATFTVDAQVAGTDAAYLAALTRRGRA